MALTEIEVVIIKKMDLNKILKAKGMTRKQLAHDASISLSVINKALGGVYRLSHKQWENISEILKI